jgi:hypothetical protein
VTRWACEKIAQNVAKPIFFSKLIRNLCVHTVEKIIPMLYKCYFKKYLWINAVINIFKHKNNTCLVNYTQQHCWFP